MKLVTIYDSKAKYFSKNVQVVRDSEVAKRGFSLSVNSNDPNSNLAQFPSDFYLVEIADLGDFNELTGTFEKFSSTPEFIVNGLQVVRSSDVVHSVNPSVIPPVNDLNA